MHLKGFTRIESSLPSELAAQVPGWQDPPDWMACVLVKEAGSTKDLAQVYLPAEIFKNFLLLLMYSLSEDVDGVSYRGHRFLPADWIIKYNPQWKEVIQTMASQAI